VISVILFSRSHVNKYLGIVLDKKVLSCPIIKNPIIDGQVLIQGGFTRDQARALGISLRIQDPLPVPLEIVDFINGGK